MDSKHLLSLLAATLALNTPLAAEEPAFESELFESGTLVYTDDFDGEFNPERWGALIALPLGAC